MAKRTQEVQARMDQKLLQIISDRCQYEPGMGEMQQSQADQLLQFESLLQVGASPNQLLPHGKSLLQATVSIMNDSKLAALLLNAGADVNFIDGSGNTALTDTLLSSLSGSTPFSFIDNVRLLVAHGADVNHVAGDTTSLMLSCRLGYLRHLGELLLISGADVNKRLDNGNSALMTATARGHANTVKMLMEHGADMLMAGQNGVSIYQNTLDNGQPEITAILESFRLKQVGAESLTTSAVDDAVVAKTPRVRL